MLTKRCAREACDNEFMRCGSQKFCSPECRRLNRKETTAYIPRAPSPSCRKERKRIAPQLSPRACRTCDTQFQPLRTIQVHCVACKPMVEELRRCRNCQKPFRALSRIAKFCGPNCSARWHDNMRRNAEPVDELDDVDDEDEVVVLELQDCPRRARVARLSALHLGEDLLPPVTTELQWINPADRRFGR